MKHLRPFEWTDYTFEERIGTPDALEAAVGKIMMNFSGLEHTIDGFIHYLVRLQPAAPLVDLASLAFKRKVNLLASTVSRLHDVLPFNTGSVHAGEFFRELEHNCVQAEALYNQIKVAKWGYKRANGFVDVLDPATPTRDLNQRPIGCLNAHRLLDIADFISMVGMDLDEFFLGMDSIRPQAA